MTDSVIVQTSEEKLRRLLGGEINEMTLEVFESGVDPTPLKDVEYDMRCDIAGIVRNVNSINTFDRNDGGEGQVRNIRVQDSTADIRVALWGDHADIEWDLGTPVLLENVEIQDGWQDEIEASAGWQSSIEELEDQDIDFVKIRLRDDSPEASDG